MTLYPYPPQLCIVCRRHGNYPVWMPAVGDRPPEGRVVTESPFDQ